MFCFSVLPVLIAHRKNDGKVLGAEYIFTTETKAIRFLMQKKKKVVPLHCFFTNRKK